jgi:hypothetical protein
MSTRPFFKRCKGQNFPLWAARDGNYYSGHPIEPDSCDPVALVNTIRPGKFFFIYCPGIPWHNQKVRIAKNAQFIFRGNDVDTKVVLDGHDEQEARGCSIFNLTPYKPRL